MSATSPRSRRRSLHIASESGGFGVDPSADGSGYTYAPAEQIQRRDTREILETAYSTGRNYRTQSEVGADGAEVSFMTPVIGMASAAGDGTAASSVADDWLDILLEHTFGTQQTTTGEGVASSGSGTLTLDTDAVDIQDLVPVFEASVPSSAPRSQPALITVDNTDGSYSVEPGWTTNPTTAAVAYGVKRYIDDDDGGATLAACVSIDSDIYKQLGGRVTRCVIRGEHKRRIMFDWSVAFDNATEDASGVTALPSATAVAPTPLKLFRSPMWFGGTAIPTKSIEIDFGINASEVGASSGSNGREDQELVSIDPVITIEPRYSDTYLNYKRNGTTGRLIGQLGAGELSGGVLNVLLYCFDLAEAYEVEERDDAGHLRQLIRFRPVDRITFSGSTASRFFQVVRA